MKKQEIDHILVRMLDYHRDVSDLNFTVGKPMQVESAGELIPVDIKPSFKALSPFQTEILALNLINQDRRLTETLLKSGSCDLSYGLPGKARFRINIFSQGSNLSIVLRKLESKIPTIEERALPKTMYQIAQEKNGRPFGIDSLREIQLSKRDVLDNLAEARKQFSTEEWKTFLLRSIGIEPGTLSQRVKDSFMLRMVPFVERNYNIVELGPRGTGKSHLFQQISPYAHLISGGKATVEISVCSNPSGGGPTSSSHVTTSVTGIEE